MAGAIVRHGAVGGDEGLRDDLSAEDALAFLLIRALAAEEIQFQALDIEQGQQVAYGIGGHSRLLFIVVRRSIKRSRRGRQSAVHAGFL